MSVDPRFERYSAVTSGTTDGPSDSFGDGGGTELAVGLPAAPVADDFSQKPAKFIVPSGTPSEGDAGAVAESARMLQEPCPEQVRTASRPLVHSPMGSPWAASESGKPAVRLHWSTCG